LKSDKDVITFINFHKGYAYVDIYVENFEPYFVDLDGGLDGLCEGVADEGLGEEGSEDYDHDEDYNDED
jgi:hypothetical protein